MHLAVVITLLNKAAHWQEDVWLVGGCFSFCSFGWLVGCLFVCCLLLVVVILVLFGFEGVFLLLLLLLRSVVGSGGGVCVCVRRGVGVLKVPSTSRVYVRDLAD